MIPAVNYEFASMMPAVAFVAPVMAAVVPAVVAPVVAAAVVLAADGAEHNRNKDQK